ncbi:MAG: hypothetical protein J4G13_15295 [Dehalococcoidia bacterium]|nr:hypothetical protein [Dehalococcoidia bacterium]
MAVKFNIDLDAIANAIDQLRNASGAPDRESRNRLLTQLAELLLFWECHGILCTGGLTRNQLIDQIDASFPDTHRSTLQSLLRGLRNRPNGRSHLRIFEESIPNHVGCCQLSITSDTEIQPGAIGAASLSGFFDSRIVREAWGEDDWVIPIGCRPETIWHKRFRPYGETTDAVTIVDPYVMEDNGTPRSSLTIFFDLLDKTVMENQYQIDIHTRDPGEQSMRDKFAADLSGTQPRASMHIYFHNDTNELAFPRDRWVRFGQMVFKWHGVDTLTRPVTGDSCDKQQTHANGDLMAIENRLKALRQPDYTV